MDGHLLMIMASFAVVWLGMVCTPVKCSAVSIKEVRQDEDLFGYMTRVKGRFDQTLYRQLIGAANEFKEGDVTIGVAADTDKDRQNARKLLSNTKIKDLFEHPLLADDLQKLIWETTSRSQHEKVAGWTMGRLKEFLLTASEAEIKGIMFGLSSETIGCVPKLMTNEELIALNSKVFNRCRGPTSVRKGTWAHAYSPIHPPTIRRT